MKPKNNTNIEISGRQLDARIILFLEKSLEYIQGRNSRQIDILSSDYWFFNQTLPANVISSKFHYVGTANVKKQKSSFFRIYLKKVQYNKESLLFDKGISLEVIFSYSNGIYTVYDEKFNIYGSGSTKENAMRDYEKFFIELYKDIVNTPDEELPASTLSFKNTLKCFASLRHGS